LLEKLHISGSGGKRVASMEAMVKEFPGFRRGLTGKHICVISAPMTDTGIGGGGRSGQGLIINYEL
jgi:hypothetical protein